MVEGGRVVVDLESGAEGVEQFGVGGIRQNVGSDRLVGVEAAVEDADAVDAEQEGVEVGLLGVGAAAASAFVVEPEAVDDPDRAALFFEDVGAAVVEVAKELEGGPGLGGDGGGRWGLQPARHRAEEAAEPVHGGRWLVEGGSTGEKRAGSRTEGSNGLYPRGPEWAFSRGGGAMQVRDGAMVVVMVLGLGVAGWAQEIRYELGRRVRVMERAWEVASPEARRAASPTLSRAVQSFFGMRLKEAGRAVAEATWAVQGREPSERERLVAALWVRPARRLVDAAERELSVRIEPFYEAGVGVGAGNALRLQAWLRPEGDHRAPRVVAEADWAGSKPEGLLRGELRVKWEGLEEGDYWLTVVVVDEAGQPVGQEIEVGVSLAEGLRERLEAAQAAVGAWEREQETIETATARGLLEQLRGLADGDVLETDVPAARRLRELEALIAAVADWAIYYKAERTGDFWIRIPVGEGREVAARLAVPERGPARAVALSRGDRAGNGSPGVGAGQVESGRPDGLRPLVVALHGAGGSENMFFDSYGDGKIVRLCGERGWLLVAPRGAGRVEEVVEALAARYPVDRGRVYLVGHSMGAMAAVGEASRRPEWYAAVAALGGGGRLRVSEGLRAVRFFVGVGTEDFALRGARGLRAALETAGVRSIRYREYEGIEHLAVVQEALFDVFEWLAEE